MRDAWTKCRLGGLVHEMQDGGTPSTARRENFGGEIPWVVIKDIAPIIELTESTLSAVGLASSSARLWPAGTVILSTGATIGEVGIAGVPLATKQGITGIRCNELLNNKYLRYFLLHIGDFLRANSQGSTIREIRAPFLSQIEIDLPPLGEQLKIASILEAMDKAIEQTEAIIAKQERIKKGLMQDLLTKGIDEHGNIRTEVTHKFKDSPLGRIPEEWEVVAVEECASQVTDGDHLTPRRTSSGYLLLSARNIRDGKIDLSDVDYVGKAEYERMIRRCFPEPGDILVSCSGSVGRVCCVPDWLNCVLVRSVALVKLKGERCTSSWGEWYFRSWLVQHQIRSEQLQAAQPNLFQGPIRRLKVALPTTEEQRRVSRQLDGIETVTTHNRIVLTKLFQLKAGLMQDLLSGNVPVTHLLKQTDSTIVENLACPA